MFKKDDRMKKKPRQRLSVKLLWKLRGEFLATRYLDASYEFIEFIDGKIKTPTKLK